jgi:hypothetical protein
MEKRAGEDQKGDSEYATGGSSARGCGLMSSCFYFPFFPSFFWYSGGLFSTLSARL